MAQGKCNLLKPVDSLTGTFFMFSQYTQDLTKQYTQGDEWRCIPSKFAAFNLNLDGLGTFNPTKKLGEIFQNYFENACTFLRANETQDKPWNPEYSRTLLFQTLQKYGMMTATKQLVRDTQGNLIGGVSEQLQYIGDINLYSYEELKDGMGYNEIYCYIPNDAKCKDYLLSGEEPQDAVVWPSDKRYICGYEGQTPYNNLGWLVNGYTDLKADASSVYSVGKYGLDLCNLTLIPQLLGNHNETTQEYSDDSVRKNAQGGNLDEFDVNAIVVFYDIVTRNGAEDDRVIHYNVPLGIYFTGKPANGTMSNTITKYISSDEVYNQGTSYGLRICSRFLSQPNSEEKVVVEATGSTNVAEMAPVLEKMGETLAAVQDVLKSDDKMYNLVKDHLANFKNNKVNVPYVRKVGTKKYWFVNGKNTGAIAEYELSGVDDIITLILQQVLLQVFTKQEINNILNLYITRDEFEQMDWATKTYVDNKFYEIVQSLKVYLQGE